MYDWMPASAGMTIRRRRASLEWQSPNKARLDAPALLAKTFYPKAYQNLRCLVRKERLYHSVLAFL